VADARHSDETLLQLIAEHDAAALEVLYDRYAQVVYNLSMRIVREAATADDVLQDTFWQVWQKAGDYRGSGVAAAWLCRIARNKSLDQLRRQQARPQPLLTTLMTPEQTISSAATGALSVEDQAEHAWRQRHIREALGDIPAEQRQCLELAYFEGMSQREIAALMETPLGTVKTRIRIGLDKLARILRSAGWEAEDA